MSEECSPVGISEGGVGSRDDGSGRAENRIGRFQLADDGTVLAVDDRLVEVTGFDRSAVVGEHVTTLLCVEESMGYVDALGRCRQRGVLEARTLDVTIHTACGAGLPCTARVQALEGEAGQWASLGELYDRSADGVFEDPATGREVASLDGAVRRLGREMGGVASGDELAAAVTDRLVALPRYDGVWFGRSRRRDAVLEPVASAGLDAPEGTSRTLRTDAEGPIGRAVDTGEVQVSVPGDPVGDGALPTDATVAAVPLVHRETVYGLLVVTTESGTAVGPAERTALADLGAMLGRATCCLRARRSLMAGQVTEVTLRVREEGLFLATLSERLGCRVAVEGVAFASDGTPLHYVTVHCGAPERIRRIAAELTAPNRFEVVSEHGDACVVAVEPPGPTLHRVASDHGGAVHDLVFEGGDATVTVELPDAGDTRALVAALRAQFDSVTLAAQRDRDRSIETRRQFRTALLDRLSDRQRTALRLAHHAGYFEWPRESTGEDIAASMDVSPPTFHKHLRHAQQKLAGAVVAPEEGC